jgi:hypothetical protein
VTNAHRGEESRPRATVQPRESYVTGKDRKLGEIVKKIRGNKASIACFRHTPAPRRRIGRSAKRNASRPDRFNFCTPDHRCRHVALSHCVCHVALSHCARCRGRLPSSARAWMRARHRPAERIPHPSQTYESVRQR